VGLEGEKKRGQPVLQRGSPVSKRDARYGSRCASPTGSTKHASTATLWALRGL